MNEGKNGSSALVVNATISAPFAASSGADTARNARLCFRAHLFDKPLTIFSRRAIDSDFFNRQHLAHRRATPGPPANRSRKAPSPKNPFAPDICAESALVTPTRIACMSHREKSPRSSPLAVLKTNTSPTYLLPMANGTFTRRCLPPMIGQVITSEVSRMVVTPALGSAAQEVLRP